MNTHLSFSKAKEEFEEAWNNPAHTPIESDAIDINALLQASYSTSEPFSLTRPMLWDAEMKKAWDPMTYSPHIVQAGEAWGRTPLKDGEESFRRASRQSAWKADINGQVLEEVYLSPNEQSVLFLGRADFVRDDGSSLQAGSHQPLFHVEHAVGGTDSRPLNVWRIVHLTTERDDELIKRQATDTGSADWLREFIAIYVKKDLGIDVARLPE